ncbi:MAG: response regulator transcription factor [Oscillospiraceae bacterium]|nr:response regulator transcription factor [Oscillospiraceae bacterium]
MNVLLVEDDRALSNAVKQILTQRGYNVDAVYDGLSAVDYAEGAQYSVIILDGMLPKLDGLEVLRVLRRDGVQTPILMLTARSTVQDKVAGLDGGADDYLTKPFDTEELLARVGALTRRKGEVVVDTLDFDDLSLDVHSAVLSCNGATVQLSKKEFQMLRCFLTQPTATVPKETLIVNVWGTDADTTDNNAEAYISFLRKKLAYLKSRVSIRTVPRIGYRLEVEAC